MEKIGLTKQTLIVFIVASMIQIMWGCEACFISIFIQLLGENKEVPQLIISFSICLLFSMMGIGSFIMSFLSKYLGRIKSILICIFFYFLSISTCTFIDNFYIIIGFRCIANICIGINNLLTLNLLSEYLPTKNRCFILMQYSSIYNFGNLYCILLKLFFNVKLNEFSTFGWRASNQLSCISGIFSFIIMLIFVKESPIYLISINEYEQAFEIISKMASSKKIFFGPEDEREITGAISRKKNAKLHSYFSELFDKEYIVLTMLNLFISVICYTNMIAISYLVPKTIKELGNNLVFSEDEQLVIYGLIQLPNGIIGGYMSECKHFGRIRTIYINSFLCGFFYFLTFFCTDYLCYFSGMIMLFNSITFGVAYIYVSEAFPTKLRDQSQSFIQFLTFAIGSFSPIFIDNVSKGGAIYHYNYFGISCLVCSVLAFFLPFDTFNRPLDFEDDLSN